MKYKIIITIILFIFSFLLIKCGVFFIKENDSLMKTLKEKQNEYNKDFVDAIITEHTMIPGISGKKINLNKSYQKMKGINEFKKSLLVFDEIKPNKTISNVFDKVIISGNPKLNKISIITNLNDDYCYTENLSIEKECMDKKKHTLLIYKINNDYLTNIKQIIKNGILIYLSLENNSSELKIIVKYLKNNNYKIVTPKELISE